MSTVSTFVFTSDTETVTRTKLNNLVANLLTEFNGNITNTNISSAAAIAYSKLALTGAVLNADLAGSIAYSKLTLSNSIVNADINSSAAIVASKLDLTSPGAMGTTAPAAGKFTTLEATSTFKSGTTNQGDILYDNGTSIVRLTPGTSGQFLRTQGASANPIWAAPTSPSNVLFSWSGNETYQDTGNGNTYGLFQFNSETLAPIDLSASSTNPVTSFIGTDNGSAKTFFNFRFSKIAGISTVTCHFRIWASTTNASNEAVGVVDINGLTVSVTSVTSATPSWYSGTIDVSSLSNGTSYNGVVQLYSETAGTDVYMSAVTIVGS